MAEGARKGGGGRKRGGGRGRGKKRGGGGGGGGKRGAGKRVRGSSPSSSSSYSSSRRPFAENTAGSSSDGDGDGGGTDETDGTAELPPPEGTLPPPPSPPPSPSPPPKQQNQKKIPKSSRVTSSETDALDWTVPTFGRDVAGTYDDCSDLRSDLTNAIAYVANSVILYNAENEHGFTFPMFAPPRPGPPDSSSPGAGSGGGLNSFDTNRQEADVDEPDVIKSDGTVTYAGYGEEVICLDARTGAELSRIVLPVRRRTHYRWRPRVAGLFLSPSRLVVLSTNYFSDPPPEVLGSDADGAVLTDYGAVLAEVYDVSDPTDPARLGRAHLDGALVDARTVGTTVHVVTSSGIDVWGKLGWRLQRSEREYSGLDRDGYVDKAVGVAEEVMPPLVSQLMREMRAGGTCADVAKMSLFHTSGGDNDDDSIGTVTASVKIIPYPDWGGYFREHLDTMIIDDFLRVITFDYASDPLSFPKGDIRTHRAAVIMPTHWYFVYASRDVLAIPGRASSADDTVLRVLRLKQDGAEAAGVAVVPGKVKDQFSVDEYDGDLRVASTTPERWECRNETALDLDEDLEMWDDSCDFGVVSNSTSQVTIWRLPREGESGTMIERVGFSGDLGLNEDIYAVRFMDERAYVVTFRRTDPFYSLDLTDPTDIPKPGELKITGFSNYLHPLDAEGNIIVSVGMDADRNGRTLGFAISLFNVTDLTEPVLLDRHLERKGPWSGARYDHHAFRAVPGPDGTWSVVIVPVTFWGTGDDDTDDAFDGFDGFKVYNVTYGEGGGDVRYMFNVSHAENETGDAESLCSRPPYMPPRSLVIEGTLTTIKVRTLLNVDMETGDELWRTDLTVNSSAKASSVDCYPF